MVLFLKWLWVDLVCICGNYSIGNILVRKWLVWYNLDEFLGLWMCKWERILWILVSLVIWVLVIDVMSWLRKYVEFWGLIVFGLLFWLGVGIWDEYYLDIKVLFNRVLKLLLFLMLICERWVMWLEIFVFVILICFLRFVSRKIFVWELW